jgi:hypothetical protein
MDPNGDYISGRFRYLSRGGGADGDEAKGTGRDGRGWMRVEWRGARIDAGRSNNIAALDARRVYRACRGYN